MNRSLQYSDNKSIDYNIKDVFDIIIDIEQYSEFLPWLSQVVVTNEEVLSQAKQTDINIINSFDALSNIISVMSLKKSFFSFDFYCNIEITNTEKDTININLIDTHQSFKNFKCYWTLTKSSETSTKIAFFIDFELKSSALNYIVRPIFKMTAKSVSQAFIARIEEKK